jgi:hypothetical protein
MQIERDRQENESRPLPRSHIQSCPQLEQRLVYRQLVGNAELQAPSRGPVLLPVKPSPTAPKNQSRSWKAIRLISTAWVLSLRPTNVRARWFFVVGLCVHIGKHCSLLTRQPVATPPSQLGRSKCLQTQLDVTGDRDTSRDPDLDGLTVDSSKDCF